MTTTATTLTLSDLACGVGATVVSINDNANGQVDASMTARLGELGFLPGERVSVLRRGPGGREPLAVQDFPKYPLREPSPLARDCPRYLWMELPPLVQDCPSCL